MRILITGGAGFVGSHLSDELLGPRHSVHVLDDLSTGAIDNIRHLGTTRASSTRSSPADERPLVAELVDEARRRLPPGGRGRRRAGRREPGADDRDQRALHRGRARAAPARRGSRCFVASTSEVYGKSDGAAVPRGRRPASWAPTYKGRWSYACSKAIDEFLALAYWKERGLPTVIGRMFNTVGPRQTGRYGMVVPSFVGQALAGQPLRVFGDGTQTRCFCHVDDVVRALADLMERDDAYGEVFNIGDAGRDLDPRARRAGLRRARLDVGDRATSPTTRPTSEGFEDMHRRVPDIAKVRTVRGGWAPTRSLEDMIRDVRDHQLESRQLGVAA